MKTKRRARPLLLAAVLLGTAAASPAVRASQVRVDIEDPALDGPLTGADAPVEIRGRAEILGARALDLFLVLDSSKSLQRTDPGDLRTAGARALASNLLALGRTRIGVVDFDSRARIVVPLTAQRERILAGLETLDQKGRSNPAAGIRAALDGFGRDAAPDTARVALLFTDGHVDAEAVARATRDARSRGVAVHTVLVGGDTEGEAALREIAAETRGTFVRLVEPASLTRVFLGLRATGVEEVSLLVDGGEPVPAQVAGASFRGLLRLPVGESRIVARATGPDGATSENAITVTVRPPGCAELALRATRDGAETLSLSERNVEIVLDASNSMWGRMQGATKLEVAQRTLDDLVTSLPEDLRVGLRVYGHRHDYELRECGDTELLVPPTAGSRESIRTAIAELEPRGQTPLAHALEQVAADFEGLRGERAVVLVTDGIESCGGDPVGAVRALQTGGALPVHVIGFGLPDGSDEDADSLRAIARASGGRFVGVRSAGELYAALAGAVGTAFRVNDANGEVAAGTLGGGEPVRLPAGQYSVRLAGSPGFSLPVILTSGERLTLTLEVDGSRVEPRGLITPTDYAACAEPAPRGRPGTTQRSDDAPPGSRGE